MLSTCPKVPAPIPDHQLGTAASTESAQMTTGVKCKTAVGVARDMARTYSAHATLERVESKVADKSEPSVNHFPLGCYAKITEKPKKPNKRKKKNANGIVAITK